MTQPDQYHEIVSATALEVLSIEHNHSLNYALGRGEQFILDRQTFGQTPLLFAKFEEARWYDAFRLPILRIRYWLHRMSPEQRKEIAEGYGRGCSATMLQRVAHDRYEHNISTSLHEYLSNRWLTEAREFWRSALSLRKDDDVAQWILDRS